MGDSAGGNLATVVCQRLLRQKRAYIRCQVLINPVTHALDFQSSSYRDYYRSCKDTALLDPSTLAMWYLLYLGIKPTRRNIKSVLQNRHFSKDRLELDDILSSLIDSASTPKKPLSTSQLDKAIEVFPNAEVSDIITRRHLVGYLCVLWLKFYPFPFPSVFPVLSVFRSSGYFCQDSLSQSKSCEHLA